MSEQSDINKALSAALAAAKSAEASALAAEESYKHMLKAGAFAASCINTDGMFSLIKMGILLGGEAGEYCYLAIKKDDGVYKPITLSKEEVEGK